MTNALTLAEILDGIVLNAWLAREAHHDSYADLRDRLDNVSMLVALAKIAPAPSPVCDHEPNGWDCGRYVGCPAWSA